MSETARYRVQSYSPGTWGAWDTQEQRMVKNPESNRTRLFRSPQKAGEFVDRLNSEKAGEV